MVRNCYYLYPWSICYYSRRDKNLTTFMGSEDLYAACLSQTTNPIPSCYFLLNHLMCPCTERLSHSHLLGSRARPFQGQWFCRGGWSGRPCGLPLQSVPWGSPFQPLALQSLRTPALPCCRSSPKHLTQEWPCVGPHTNIQ